MGRALSEIERQIISAAQLQADLPITELAKQVKMKSHTVRYALERLLREKIISPYPFINYVPLGFHEHDLYCSLKFRDQEDRSKFISYLKQSRSVSWLIELGGDYQYGIGVIARDIYEVQSVIDGIASRFGPIFMEKTFATCLRWSVFRRKYLTSKVAKINELKVGPSSEAVKVDEQDLAILAAMSKFPEYSSKELAKLVNLPPTTFGYRVGVLRNKGIYLGLAYGLEPTRFGMQVFRLQIALSNPGHDQVRRLYEVAKASPWVMSFVEFYGGWDIAMRVEVPQPSEAFALGEHLVDSFGDSIRSLRLLPVFHEQKLQPFPWFNNK